MRDFVSDVVCLRAGSGSGALYCVDPQKLQAVTAALRGDRALWGVTSGNFGATAVAHTVETIAAGHVRRLMQSEDRGPYSLLGYSFGGLIAYEMAVGLVRAGREVASLYLIDTPHPGFREALSADESAHVQAAYLADRKAKYLRHLRHGRLDLLARGTFAQIRNRLAPLAWRAVRGVCHVARLPAPTVLQDLRIEAMWHAYRPGDFPGRMLLFRAEGRDAEFAGQPAMGWSRCVRGGIDIRYAKGLHETLFTSPYAESLARQIDDALAGSRT